MNKKSIMYSLSMLAILTLGVITMPAKADARAGYVTPYNSTRWVTVRSNNDYDPYVGDINASLVPTIYSGSTGAKTTVAKANTTKSTTTATTATTEKPADKVSDLAANAIFGTGGFLPSGLVTWIGIAILILLIVILVRKVTRTEDKYHAEPMKHA